MPASGSSNRESLVCRASTVAISMRLISPPERVASTSRFRYSRPHSPTRLSISQSLSVESFPPEASSSRRRTVKPLKRTGCWKAKLTPCRARSVTFKGVMSSPSKRIFPLSGVSIPAMILAKVVLPPPLGPVITVSFPSGMERLTSRRTWLPSGAVQEMCCSSNIARLAPFYGSKGESPLLIFPPYCS